MIGAHFHRTKWFGVATRIAVIGILDGAATLAPWACLIVIATNPFEWGLVLPLLSITIASLAVKVWMLPSWLYSDALGTEPETKVIYDSLMLALVIGFGFVISNAFGVILAAAAGLGWILPLVQSKLLPEHELVAFQSAARELDILGFWRNLCTKFGFNPVPSQAVIGSIHAGSQGMFQAAATSLAIAMVYVFDMSHAFSALLVLLLASFSVVQTGWSMRNAVTDLEMGQRVLATEQLTVEFSRGDFGILSLENILVPPVNSFSCELYQGLCLMFVGHSGSGKSELLRGLVTGTAVGKATLTHVGSRKPESLFAYAPSEMISISPSLDAWFDYPSIDYALAVSVLQDLDPYGDVFAGGFTVDSRIDINAPHQAKLLSLSRCFASDAPVLVFDSPEYHLDRSAITGFTNLALKAKLEGKILLISTENEGLMSLADELVKLDRGEITDRGPMEEVRMRHRERFVRGRFAPTVPDAFRLGLWLDSLIPESFPSDVTSRVKYGAEDLLLKSPRTWLGGEKPVYFDIRFEGEACYVTMLDRGEPVGWDGLTDPETGVPYRSTGHDPINLTDALHPLAALLSVADAVGEGQSQGFRQVSAVFKKRSQRNNQPFQTTEIKTA